MTYGVFAIGTEDYGATPSWSAATSGPPWVFIEVAWASNPAATIPAWVDVSDRFISFSVNRGRQRELDTFQAGRATITLTNEDRALEAGYAASPFYPNVVPMRRIRVRAVWAGVTYDVFTGYVDSYQQEYDPPNVARCVIQATDAFKVLANVTLPNSVYEAEVRADNPSHWWRLGEPQGSTVAADSANTTSPVSGTYVNGVTLGTQGAPTHDSNTAATFDGVDDYVTFGPSGRVTALPYTIEVWLKLAPRTSTGENYFFSQNRTAGTATQNQPRGSVSGTDLGSPGQVRWENLISPNRIDDNAWHHVVITADVSGGQTLYIDGVSQATGTANVPGQGASELLLGIPDYSAFVAVARQMWNGSIDEVAIYPTALSATRVAAHNSAARTPWTGDTSGARIGRVLDAAGWSTADRNLDVGLASLQAADLSGDTLSTVLRVDQTEYGGATFVTKSGQVRFIGRDKLLSAPYSTSQGTFGDSGSELEYADLTYQYDDQLIYNEARVSRSNGTVRVASDATSQTRYLRRTRTVDGLLHQSDSTSLDLANWIVAHYKDPVLRVVGLKLEPSAGNEATHFPHVLGRELMDRVTVLRRPQNLSPAIQQDVLVEGISHQVTAMTWETTWNLTPAETQVYWLAGVAGASEAGQTTRAGF